MIGMDDPAGLDTAREHSPEESAAKARSTAEVEGGSCRGLSNDRFRTVEDRESDLQREDRRTKRGQCLLSSYDVVTQPFSGQELLKLRKKIGTTVQILSHIKEKLNYVGQQRAKAESTLEQTEAEVKQVRSPNCFLLVKYVIHSSILAEVKHSPRSLNCRITVHSNRKRLTLPHTDCDYLEHLPEKQLITFSALISEREACDELY